MKIALIGGGIISIPPKKIGALEMIMWNYKLELEKLGHEVVIFNNQDLNTVASQINNGGFDFVELTYSEYVSFFSINLTVPFCTACQSGYITNRKKWSIGYYSVFYDTIKCPYIIALSEDIRKLYASNGRTGFMRVLRNGIDVKNFTFRENGNNRAICLGRIEPRKRQTWLSSIMSKMVDIDFVGPIEDETFKAEGRCKYVGYWTKEEVYKNLSEYSCLVLLSDGEAAPLVVPEALAAGLSVVVSKSASANLDEHLPFISILDDNVSDPKIISEIINLQIKNNNMYRPQILEYAKTYFDNSVVVKDFIEIIKEFKNTDYNSSEKFKVPFKKLPIYLLSKFALFVKNILRSVKRVIKPTDLI